MSISDYAGALEGSGAAKHIEYLFPIFYIYETFLSQYSLNIYLSVVQYGLCPGAGECLPSLVVKYQNLWQDKKSSVISEVNLKYDDKRVFFQEKSEDIQLQ